MKTLLIFLLPFISNPASAQVNENFIRAEEGVEYKIIPLGTGDAIQPGQYMEIHIRTVLQMAGRDTLLNDSRENGSPQVLTCNSTALPDPYFRILGMMRKGDSLVTRIISDSVFKADLNIMPPFIKKGQYLVTTIRIAGIYKNKEEADAANLRNAALADERARERFAAQLIKDDQTLNKYFTDHGISNLEKTKSGVYIDVLKRGEGKLIDSTMLVNINYTGKTLKGIIFDSNTDPAKGHVEPLKVNLTNNLSLGNSVIPGMKEALLQMKKGEKVIMYIPSSLGYGQSGMGADIHPDEILIFEVEVLSFFKGNKVKMKTPVKQKTKPTSGAVNKPVKKAKH